jgi:type II secretory pathway pseudopilin PulG
MTNPKSHLKSALTLLELVITVALFAILTLVITRIYMQVLSAQDRILDEQNIVSNLNYATAVFIDQASKVTAHTLPDCFGNNTCNGQYYCTNGDNDKACFNNQEPPTAVNFIKTAEGRFQVQKGATYDIISSDVTFSDVKMESATSTELMIQIEATGNSQYGQKIYYQNYITKSF